MPTTALFDSPFFSSSYTEVVQSTMRVWSDIRLVASMVNNSYNQDDYNAFVYAIIGQLLCVDNAMAACDARIVPEDIAYLAHVLELVKQEVTALPLIPAQAQAMQRLFEAIEKKLAILLDDSQ